MVRLLALAALLAAAPAAAAVAPAVDASGLMTPAVMDALKAIKAAAPQWTSVSMTVSGGPGFVMISESSLRIDVTGSGNMGNGWFSGTAGSESVSFSAGAFGRGFSLFGSGVNVTMSRFGSGFSVFGSVDGKNISYTLDRFGSGLSVFGQSGANVSVSGWANSLSLYGQIDESRFDRKALAVMGATLALAGSAAK
jgi:hypothetical protein